MLVVLSVTFGNLVGEMIFLAIIVIIINIVRNRAHFAAADR